MIETIAMFDIEVLKFLKYNCCEKKNCDCENKN